MTQRLWRGVEGPRRCLIYPCCSELFDHRSPTTGSAAIRTGWSRVHLFTHGNHLPSPCLCKVFELGIDRAIEVSFFARRQPLSCFPRRWPCEYCVDFRVEQALQRSRPQGKTLSGFGGRKAPSSRGKLSTAKVLRIRATSAVSRDKSVRRSAQDDVFVVGWRHKKSASSRILLFAKEVSAYGTESWPELQPSPFDKLRAGSTGLD